jgi:8-hydroxy-5-deazaflavin:NADPH oxidoreductase
MDPQEPDVVGIVGAGRLGRAMARVVLRAGRRVVLANSHGPDSLEDAVSELGDRVAAGTVEQASAARIVAIAVPWPRVPDAVRGIRWNGRIVIDATNDFDGTDLNGATSSELVASLVPDARVVKAANTLRADMLAADPHEAGGQRVMFVSGDDADARLQVATLFSDAGFSTIDLGGLATGGVLQQVGGPLAGANLIRLPAAS